MEKKMLYKIRLFQIKTKPHGEERWHEFVKDDFIAIGWPQIGDVRGLDREIIKERLLKSYDMVENTDSDDIASSRKIGLEAGTIDTFVNGMRKKDYAIFQGYPKNYHLVRIVGDCEYYGGENRGMPFKRKVQHLAEVTYEELNEKVKALVTNRGSITKFQHSLMEAELKNIIKDNSEDELEDDLDDLAKSFLKDVLLNSSDDNLKLDVAKFVLSHEID